MRKTLSLLAVLILCWVLAFSQTRVITGQVKDDQGDPLPFATITIKGTNRGTTTDASGNFRISVNQGDVLVISAVGNKSRELPIGSSDTYNVALEKTGSLEEVVVTALGVQKQPKELGYSVARVKNAELTQARVTNLQNGLVGKVSGLNVTTANNGVFANTRILLRGIRSLTGNNQPLLVVDGTPMALGFINSINPNDVESVNVLKGANSAALYGPEGVNGVIVVTTKKGSGRTRPQISISNTTLFEKVSTLPMMQTRFGSGSSYDQFGDGVYDPIENQSWGAEFDGRDTILGRPDEHDQIQKVPYNYLEDEKRKFFNTGVTIQNDVSLSSGDERSNFYLSAQDIKTKGIVPGDENRRTTFRVNAGKTYGKVKAGLNLSYALTNFEVNNSGWDVNRSSLNLNATPYWYVINTPNQVPIRNYQDFRNDNWSNHNHYFNDYYPNPYEEIYTKRYKGRDDDVFGNLEISFKPFSWLNILDRLGGSLTFSNYKITHEAIMYSEYAKHNGRSISATGDVKAGVGDGQSNSSRFNNELIVTAEKEYGDFNVKALVGNLVRQTNGKSINISGSNLVIPTLFNVGNRTGEPGAGEGDSKSRLVSLFGSVGVGFRNWAFIEFTARNDWDSRLPIDNNSYFYPGVNASVILTDAVPEIGDNKILNYARIKGAWSRTGNVNINPYELESRYSQAGGFPYGTLPGFTAGNIINNPGIRPEIVESYEVGAELAFWNNRISVDFAYYYQNNNDQVINVQVSQGTGFAEAKLNAAEFYNKGYEIDLRLTPLLKLDKFTWNVGANYTYNDSKVKEVYGDLTELGIGNTAFVIKGYPAYVHKLTDWLRDTATGKVIIDPISGYPQQNPVQTIFGRTNPKHIIGINTDLTWNSITLRVVGEYRGGHYIYNSVGSSLGFTGIDRLSGTNGRQRFVFPNSTYWDGSKYVPNTSIVVTNAHYDFLQAGRFRNTTTNYYTSAAFWKIREVVLGYEIPQKWIGNGKVIKRLNVSLIGRNVLMFRPDTNWWTDPEFANTTGNAVGTTDINQTPPTRLFGFNISLTF